MVNLSHALYMNTVHSVSIAVVKPGSFVSCLRHEKVSTDFEFWQSVFLLYSAFLHPPKTSLSLLSLSMQRLFFVHGSKMQKALKTI